MACWPPVVTITSSGSGAIPSAAITPQMADFIASNPSVGPYWSASADDSWAIRVIWAAKVSGGKVEVSACPPAGRSPRAVPDRHQVAHRQRSHDPGALREQPRIALEVVCRLVGPTMGGEAALLGRGRGVLLLWHRPSVPKPPDLCPARPPKRTGATRSRRSEGAPDVPRFAVRVGDCAARSVPPSRSGAGTATPADPYEGPAPAPGPTSFTGPAAKAPQLSNSGIWQANPILISARARTARASSSTRTSSTTTRRARRSSRPRRPSHRGGQLLGPQRHLHATRPPRPTPTTPPTWSSCG